MGNIELVYGGIELLDYVKPLWEKLNKHHIENSIHFSDRFKKFTFDFRRGLLEEKALRGKIKVILAKDNENDIYIGYCISSIVKSTVDENMYGEIESIFVENNYRKYGIGDMLMKRTLDWMDENNVATKHIIVAAGNEQVISFYERYGFYVKTLKLEQK
ncbi:putative acetyltransferase [Clostridium tepidiprofundi DSM 19306]|uniref:Putative acetyltransferase n=1 Tax=Clostridium tepidiprofundi DSM 19306 TaxID=1121338 RepID=A0A151B4Z2_9CLOT|nr:N-acetyltransferase [Clostridium tepidiprofundi]KYH34956.1 putative acetyltransferase [Clostridium tepidiprofundi DSM 19306]